MKKFILKLFTAMAMIILIIVLMHVVLIVKMQPQVVREYTLEPNEKYLFIGSSEFGCALVQDSKYQNKVIYVVDTGVPTSLMHIEELERRGQLGNVKLIAVPFYEPVIAHYRRENLLPWYKELPLSWRYTGELKASWSDIVEYLASSMRWPLPLVVTDRKTGKETHIATALADRPMLFQNKEYRAMDSLAESFDFPDSLPSYWEEDMHEMFDRMNDICKRHNIRLVTVANPLLPYFYDKISPKAKAFKKKWVEILSQKGIEHVVIPNDLDEHDYVDQVHVMGHKKSEVTDTLYRLLGIDL